MQRQDPNAPWQPGLTWWDHTWRLVACATLSAIVWSSVVRGQWEQARGLFWLDITLGVLAFGLVFVRRRFPLTVALATAVFGAFSGLTAGPGTLAAVSLATRRSLPQVLVVGAVNFLAAQVFSVAQPVRDAGPLWVSTAVNLAAIAAIMAIGMYIGSRRELMWTLRERAVRAEAEQALRVDQARATERERIAREMHDVLGHRISLVTMHAGALAYRDDLDRSQVAASARVIQDNAHRAMMELRTVLGVLRGTDAELASDRPQPGLREVPTLVQEAVTSGSTVDLLIDVADDSDLPEQVGRTVYRIVQEGLTNVRKHAGAAHVSVRVSGDPSSGIAVRLQNPLPPGPRRRGDRGFGLVGLTERAELAGGRLRSQVQDGRFVLEVWLPWTP